MKSIRILLLFSVYLAYAKIANVGANPVSLPQNQQPGQDEESDESEDDTDSTAAEAADNELQAKTDRMLGVVRRGDHIRLGLMLAEPADGPLADMRSMALLEAIEAGRYDATEMLLTAVDDINKQMEKEVSINDEKSQRDVKMSRKMSALSMAVEKQDTDFVRLLLETCSSRLSKGDIATDEIAAIQAGTATITAAFGSRNSEEETRCGTKLDLDLANKDGETSLMAAVRLQNVEIAELLLNSGASAYPSTHDGETALMMAVKLKNGTRLVDLLLSKTENIDINAANRDGDTALMLAVSDIKKLDIVNLLLKQNTSTVESLRCDVNKRNALTGSTALLEAISTDNLDAVELLLLADADIKEANDAGETTLMAAIEADNYEIVSGLLRFGADPMARTKDDVSALFLARQLERPEIGALLLNYTHDTENEFDSFSYYVKCKCDDASASESYEMYCESGDNAGYVCDTATNRVCPCWIGAITMRDECDSPKNNTYRCDAAPPTR